MRPKLLLVLLLAGLLFADMLAPEHAARAAPGDELLVVDCLLPGKVRRLGRRVTFVTARRAVRTTASDCEIRGGEYTANDRANYATALRVWLPLAKGGDAAAQNHVGEIHEKGLGVEPQHEIAAAWYLKAAKQGFARAQINLGSLYERGLGVPEDMVKAVEWYRRASGLSEVGLAYVPADVKAELEELRSDRDSLAAQRDALDRELDAVRSQLERAKEELRRQHRRTNATLRELETTRVELEARRKVAERQGDTAKVARLQKALEAKAGEAKRKKRELDRLRDRVSTLNGQATRLEGALVKARSDRERDRTQQQDASVSAKQDLSETAARLREAEARLARARRVEAGGRAEVERIRIALATEQSAAKQDRARISGLERDLSAKEDTLAERDQRLAELDGEISSLHDELKALRTEATTKREVAATKRKVAAAGTRGPIIEIIEPPLARTRAADPASVNIKATWERLVIGRVQAPGGLIAFMINDEEQTTGKDGMFRVKVPVDYPETPVHIVAIDAAGLRSSLSFVMKPNADPNPEPKREAPSKKLAGVVSHPVPWTQVCLMRRA